MTFQLVSGSTNVISDRTSVVGYPRCWYASVHSEPVITLRLVRKLIVASLLHDIKERYLAVNLNHTQNLRL